MENIGILAGVLATYAGICIVFLIPFALIGYWRGSTLDRVASEELFNLKTHYAVRVVLFLLVVLMATGLYVWLYSAEMQNSGAMFIGLPALIALGIVFTRQFERQFRVVFAAITCCLLIVFFLFGEGWWCVVVAAPIFYGIGLGIVFVTRWGFKKANGYIGTILFWIVLVATSLEGVIPQFHFDRTHSVTTSDVIGQPIAAIRNNLSHTPDFDELPIKWLKLAGIPIPIKAHGEGLDAGVIREFVFLRHDGIGERVVFQVEHADETSAVLVPVYDNTVISRWLEWQKTEFQWTELDSENTRMTVTMTFRRKLDPAWYFGLFQKLVVKQAERVLIEHARQIAPDNPVQSDVNLASKR